MKMNQARFSVLLFPIIFSLQAHAQCSNATLNGTYFSSFGGTVLNGTSNVSHNDLGKVVMDGNGGITGSVTTSVAGVISINAVTGTYSLKANCSGNGTLTSGGNSVNFTMQLIGGGTQVLASVTSSTLGQIGEGRLYRASNSTGSSCGTGTLSGTYGLILSGGSYAAAVRTGYDAVSQATFDGQGNVTIAGEVSSGSSNGITWNGTGTYSMAADCTGTAQVTSPVGTVNYLLARAEGGAVLFLETDASTTISGSALTQLVEQIVPQFVYGGGWYSALYFTNTTSSSQTFVVTFTADDGTPLNVPGTGTTKRITLAPQASTVIEALNQGAQSEGYATFTVPTGVTGYLVVRQTVPGVPDQEALVGFKNANATATSFTFDETNYITGLALANPSGVAVTVTLTTWGAGGAALAKGTVTINAGQKYVNALRAIPGLSGVQGQRGSGLITVTSGNIAVLGLRFYGTAFTSIPTTQAQ